MRQCNGEYAQITYNEQPISGEAEGDQSSIFLPLCTQGKNGQRRLVVRNMFAAPMTENKQF